MGAPVPVRNSSTVAGLVMPKVSEVVPLSGMEAAPNDLAMEGGGAMTDTLADAVPPVPPSVEVTAPVVLFLVPAEVPVTLTELDLNDADFLDGIDAAIVAYPHGAAAPTDAALCAAGIKVVP